MASLEFVEDPNNKIGLIWRRAYDLEDFKYLRLEVSTCPLLQV